MKETALSTSWKSPPPCVPGPQHLGFGKRAGEVGTLGVFTSTPPYRESLSIWGCGKAVGDAQVYLLLSSIFLKVLVSQAGEGWGDTDHGLMCSVQKLPRIVIFTFLT